MVVVWGMAEGGKGGQAALPLVRHLPGRLSRGFWGMGLPPLPRPALVCASGSRAAGAGPPRCMLHIPRFNVMKREKSGAAGLTRLDPSKVLVQRGAAPAGSRGPTVFATLEALLGRVAPLTGAGTTLPVFTGLGRGERIEACPLALDAGGGAALAARVRVGSKQGPHPSRSACRPLPRVAGEVKGASSPASSGRGKGSQLGTALAATLPRHVRRHRHE